MYIKAVRQKRHLRDILMLYSKWYKKIGKSIVTESATGRRRIGKAIKELGRNKVLQVEGELAKQ